MLVFLSFWVFPFHAGAQRKSSEASRVSQSQSPDNLHDKSYSPPSSRSQRPQRRVSKSNNPSSDRFVLMNEPRGPVRPSDRARYYGIGAVELGLNVGLAHSFTDVAGKPGQENFGIIRQGNYHAGVYARYNVNAWFGISGGLSYGHLSGNNADGFDYTFKADEPALTAKVYAFENDIYEVSGKLELHGPLSKSGGVGIYGFAGFAAFYNKPVIFDEINQEINLPVAATSPASDFSFALPVGIGFRVMAANFIRLGIEIGYRYTASQGLDGVIVPGTRYDSYAYSGITIGYVLPAKK